MKLSTVFLVATLVSGFALAAPEAGTIKTVKGAVTLHRDGQTLTIAVGGKVFASDRVVTGVDGSVGITLRDNTLLSAGPNSVLSLDKFAFDPTTHAGAVDATLKRGTLAVISGKIARADPDSVRFNTPTTTLGVRGTEFVVEVSGGEE